MKLTLHCSRRLLMAPTRKSSLGKLIGKQLRNIRALQMEICMAPLRITHVKQHVQKQ